MAESLPAVHGGHEPWRYMLISGLIPAMPLLVVRPFLPESPIWQQRQRPGTLQRPSLAEIFRPPFRRTTIVATVMMACGYAASFGANLQVPRIVPGIAEVQAMSKTAQEQTVGAVQLLQELGGLAGRVALAALAVHIVGRRRLIRLFLVPGVVIMPLVFLVATRTSASSRSAVSRGILHRWPVQLLGQLPAAHVPGRLCAAREASP